MKNKSNIQRQHKIQKIIKNMYILKKCPEKQSVINNPNGVIPIMCFEI